jgi:MFS family permease
MTRAQDQQPRTARTLLPAVLALLFATGWAANHFTAMLPVLAKSEGLGRAALDGAFGIYAVGLLPGLLGGGSLSDRLGRRPLLLSGAAVAGLGNLALLAWHDEAGIFVGRLIVGAGVGVAMSAGTAWSADIGGGSGSVLAGVSLSAGFGCGPVVSALLAQFSGAPTHMPFAVTVGLSAAAVVAGIFLARTRVPLGDSAPDKDTTADAVDGQGVLPALSTALPLAMWVFACATVAMVTMVERMQYRFAGPLLPGAAAAVTLTCGVAIQVAARRWGWGPRAGTAGALAAATGFAIVAAAGEKPSLAVFLVVAVVLGLAYGLCLRQGLVDVEMLSPPSLRGTLTGVFWAVTYLGFGLPVLLVAITPAVGITAPLVVLSAVAAAVALLREIQTRRRDRVRESAASLSA